MFIFSYLSKFWKKKKRLKSSDFIKYALYFLATFPLIPNKIKGLPVAFIFIIAVFSFVNNKSFNWKFFLINSGVFISYIFSLLYTSNLNYGLKKIETSLSLLIVPLTFALLYNCKFYVNWSKLLKQIIVVFFNSVFLFSLIILTYLIYIGGFLYLDDPNFFRHFTQEIPYIGQHSIYASIFLGLGLLFSINLLNAKTCRSFKIHIIFKTLPISLLLISLASKGILLATFVSISFYCFLIIENLRSRLLTLLLICGVLTLSINYSPSLSKRINLLKLSIYSPSSQGILSSTQVRKAIYNCSIESAMDSWFFGYGIGDANDTLIHCYKNNSSYLVESKPNSHNQYLGILLISGLFGFFIMLYFLFFNLRLFIIDKNYFFLTILLFYLMVMFFENILERQSGVVLFSFLINLFSFKAFKVNFIKRPLLKCLDKS
tara:strand:- start:401 stop:1693 length:1293 start_codon:yes stop_codon:yes gene_type:complete